MRATDPSILEPAEIAAILKQLEEVEPVRAAFFHRCRNGYETGRDAQIIDTKAVNVAADISKVALICQCSKKHEGGCLEAESVLFVNHWTNYCRWYLAR